MTCASATSSHPVGVWLSFLETWTEEARLRGTKSAAAYLKAYQSLSKCQDTLTHPCETVRLRGIGESIAKRIEVEYEKWCSEHGYPVPEKPRMAALCASSSAAELPPPQKKSTRPRKTKAYVPEPRSGAHGILVAMYLKAHEDHDKDAQLGKSELIARAQPYCDNDYSVPGCGTSSAAPASLLRRGMPSGSQSLAAPRKSFATAWSSMKVLINKGYVYRSGNPALYSLSEQGLEIASILATAEGFSPTIQSRVSPPRASSEHVAAPLSSSPSTSSAQLPSSPTPSPLHPAAVMPLHSPSRTTNVARLPLHHAAPVLTASRLDSSPSPEAIQCDPQPSTQRSSRVTTCVPQLYLPPRTNLSQASIPGAAREPSPGDTINLVDSSDNTSFDAGSDGIQIINTPPRSQRLNISLIESSPIVISSSPHAISQAHDAVVGCYILPPESYTIHMVVDHREVRSRTSTFMDARQQRITFEGALTQRGVPCELRALELGDILWVARPKRDLPPDKKKAWTYVQEVVLDTVVERKRLDDLASSIFDGRWHDQKQRLRHAGIGQVIYLIEDIDVPHLMQRHGAQIQTALSSTQVIDGFFVHRTANNQGTVDFLVTLHEAVMDMYKDTPLYVLREETIAREHYDQQQRTMRAEHPGIRFHTSFHTYQQLHAKTSTASTIEATWIRMLLCARGVSADKAQEIVRHFPTPQHLLRAYSRCPSQLDAQRLLSTTIDATTRLTRRRIGRVLSERIWHILDAPTY